MHDPLLSCYHVLRSNSINPSFAFSSLPGMAFFVAFGPDRIGLFLYKKACRLFRCKSRPLIGAIQSDASPAFFVSSLFKRREHIAWQCMRERPPVSAPLQGHADTNV
ncbi:hypothetical protein PSAB6_240093 [Paraburkholderia sabiae]|nr:hypothetical protein PSAB6_240093 [Paraburkholderia sabiae]